MENVVLTVFGRNASTDRDELLPPISGLRVARVRDLDGERQILEVKGCLRNFSASPSLEQCKAIHDSPSVRAFESENNLQIVLQPIELYLEHKKPGLAVFDMDSTLIQQEVIDELARKVGRYEKVAAITEAAMRGELDFEQSLRARVKLLQGVPTTIWNELKQDVVTLTPGAPELIKVLRHLGWKTAVVSGGFTPLASWLRNLLGLDDAYANHLQEDATSGTLTGDLVQGEPIVHAAFKEQALRNLAMKYGIPVRDTIAVGDGSNDLLMMNTAGLGIAFNAKPKVQAAAPTRLNSDTLLDVMSILGYTREEILLILGK